MKSKVELMPVTKAAAEDKDIFRESRRRVSASFGNLRSSDCCLHPHALPLSDPPVEMCTTGFVLDKLQRAEENVEIAREHVASKPPRKTEDEKGVLYASRITLQ